MRTASNTLIIGAGLSGLSTAYHLKKDYTLLEKEPKPGGMASSDIVGDFIFDKTGHFLHFQTDYVQGILFKLDPKLNPARHKRSSWIFSKETYTRYPFQVNTYRLPPAIIKDCIVKMAKAQMGSGGSRSPSNFKEWILSSFGEGIARYFMFPYNRKLWKVPLHKINTDWVDKFIPKTNLHQAIMGAVSDYKRNFGYNRIFYYPQAGGVQKVADAFLRRVRPRTVFKKRVARINLKEKKAYFNGNQSISFNRLVSTIPLPELMGMIEDLPLALKQKTGQLKYVSVFNLNLGIDRDNLSSRHWIYFPEKKYIFYRVGFFSSFSRGIAPKGTSSLYIEVSYRNRKPLGHNNARIKKRIIEDLKRVKILADNDRIIAQKINDIKYAYPLHDDNHRELVGEIKDFFKAHGVYLIGRYGSWKYMTMEECILEGKAAADSIRNS